MILAKVVGTVVATQKSESLEGLKLLVVRPANFEGRVEAASTPLVAADAAGAGVGELVLVAQGSGARQTDFTDGRPSDATIIAVVDTVEVEGRESFRKY